MRTAHRNKRPFWYRLYEGEAELQDEWGNWTGEQAPSYSAPVALTANISPATGQSGTEQFGNLDDYDRVIVTAWMDCPIDENSVLYLDSAPEQDETTGEWSAHDYIVRRVSKSLNHISIAVSKVTVTA